MRTYIGKSGQRYREIARDECSITLRPEYPTTAKDTLHLPIAFFLDCGFVEEGKTEFTNTVDCVWL